MFKKKLLKAGKRREEREDRALSALGDARKTEAETAGGKTISHEEAWKQGQPH